MAKHEFLSKSGLYIYDEELKQYLEEQFGSGISEALVDANGGDPIYIWIGTKEEYNSLSDEEKNNCLCIITNDTENIEFENTTNKVTEINDTADNTSYPTTLAVKNYMSNISGYIKSENKSTVISNASTDDTIPSSKSVYDHTNNTVNSAKSEILTTLENRVYGVEKQTNKVTEITEDAKHTTYPSSRAVLQAIQNFSGGKVETVDTITAESTHDEVASAKAVHDFVMNSTPDSVPTVHTVTSEPDASLGKIGDIAVVI